VAGTEPEVNGDVLIGRDPECAAIDRLLRRATDGKAGSLVIRGEPGIGKSALLARAEQAAAGSTVLRTAGQEAESDLAFAGLYGLLRPIADQLSGLPEHQAAALGSALGLVAPPPERDRFLVAAATLSLLAAGAEDQLLLCVIDDAQWLDSASSDALLFAARRLRAEPIAMLFAVRDDGATTFPATSLAEMVVEGLKPAAATQLLASAAPEATEAARAWLLAEAAGNPLALLELPRGLTPAQLEGRAALPETAALSTRLQAAFADRIGSLPAATRGALLIAALADGDELSVVLRAAAALGLPDDCLDPAELTAIVRIADSHLTFRHPLARAAVRHTATADQTRQAHAALAGVLDDGEHEDRSVWHRALASLAPDAEVADALDASAQRSQARGAHGAAATALGRAAELTDDAGRRGDRLARAAQASWSAGDADRAIGLVTQALPLSKARTRATLLALRGVIEARTGDVRAATEILLEAADMSDDPSLTLALLTEATEAATYAGDYAQTVALGVRAATITATTETDMFRAEALSGLAAALVNDHERATPLLTSAIRRADRLDDPLLLIWAARMATLSGTHGDGLAQASRAVTIARDRALLSVLPAALQEQSTAFIGRGRFDLAYGTAEESIRLTRDFGQRWGASWNLANLASLDALRGDERRARVHADEALQLATASGAAFIVGFATRALGLLDLTLGRAGEAMDRLLPLATASDPRSNPLIALWSIPDLVEAAAQAGRLDEVSAHLQRYAEAAERAPSAPRRSMLARCRALAADGDPRVQFKAAVAEAGSLSPFQHGRTELHYGEWLRRSRQPREARRHLRTAADLFRLVAVTPWEQRAERELRATGERPRRRDPSTIDQLTPQELQIAGLVAAGQTNRQIAAQLYLSPRTIDYHLHKVFIKLGLTSRIELARLDLPRADSE
jgi:DNA-binding CsgD family transcriptional regulator